MSTDAIVASGITAAHPACVLFEGPWPILDHAPTTPDDVLGGITAALSSDYLIQCIECFTLGTFFIDCSLLAPHHTQRKLNDAHVDNLVDEFAVQTVQRSTYPGVVIAASDAWNNMLNLHRLPIKITNKSEHLPLL